MRVAVLLALVCGCGRIGFDPSAGGDGGSGDGAPPTGTWERVVASDDATCAINSDHDAWCWGRNTDLVLGNGTSTFTSAPAQLPGAWEALSIGESGTCGIQTDHRLWCWGNGGLGQLGDGTMMDHLSPTKVGTEVGWSEVAFGYRHACALRQDRSLWCWGDNGLNQFLPTGPAYTTPQMVTTGVRALAVRNDHTLIVRDDGTLWGAGQDKGGGLGADMDLIRLVGLTQIGSDNDWAEVATGLLRSCAVKTDGTLWCTGNADHGALGRGDENPTDIFERVGTQTDWATVEIGADHACGTKQDGSTWCWGGTERGELGPSTADALVPTRLGAFRAIAIGDHTCVVTTLGALQCMGGNNYGQIRDPSGARLVAIQADPGPWVELRARFNTACTRDTVGDVYCWGDNLRGTVGDGTRRARQVPTKVPGSGFTMISTGSFVSLGVQNGVLMEWGTNPVSYQAEYTPVASTLAFNDFVALDAGRVHACALRGNGDLYCWGANDFGQLGIPGPSLVAPALVGSGFTQMATGLFHTCGIQAGVLKCWGDNLDGEIGNGGTTTATSPTNVTCGVCNGQVAQLALGDYFTCVRLATGALYCWGDNSLGQFGDGTTTGTLVPTAAGGVPTNWAKISVGDVTTCGIRTDGSLWCWGHGDLGQVGNGAYPGISRAPTRVGTSTEWKEIAVGNHFSCALSTDGARWCWGENRFGTLGDGEGWIDNFVTIEPDR